MDVVERVRAAARKKADEAEAELMDGIRRVRDEHAASANHHRAEIARLEREIANLDADAEKIRRLDGAGNGQSTAREET